MTDFQFRIWVYLITYVDDYGRGSADPELLKGFVFPRRKRVSECDIEKALAELAGMGCILLYDIDGESYFCFPNWGVHQRIQTKKSKFPAPGENQNPPGSTVSHGESPLESESESKSNPIQFEEGGGRTPREKFTPPTLEEVSAYCRYRKNKVDPQRWIDYYASNGWKVGKNSMEDWRSDVRRWEKNEFNDNRPKRSAQTSGSSIDKDELSMMIHEQFK